MNIATFVRAECCNHRKSDGCCWPNDDSCLVVDSKRCGYFEIAVLPIANQASPHGQEGNRYSDGLQHGRQQARAEYTAFQAQAEYTAQT